MIMRVGIVGWRGMVGSVLMQRMRDEGDFALIEPVFFSTSKPGGPGPATGRDTGPVKDGNDPRAFAGLDAIVTCQGGDWTTAMHPKLRDAGFTGYWIDAAKTLRMKDNAVALALYRKFGFEIEGTLQNFAFRGGRFIDAYTMARLAPVKATAPRKAAGGAGRRKRPS